MSIKIEKKKENQIKKSNKNSKIIEKINNKK